MPPPMAVLPKRHCRKKFSVNVSDLRSVNMFISQCVHILRHTLNVIIYKIVPACTRTVKRRSMHADFASNQVVSTPPRLNTSRPGTSII
jgi:hypothetical protein